MLRNPVYFIFLILVGAGAYVTYTLNLWGPMINMANAASSQALEEGKKRLREFLEASDTGRPSMAMPSSGRGKRDGAAGGRSGGYDGYDGYEMRRMNGGGGDGRTRMEEGEGKEEEEDGAGSDEEETQRG